MGKEKKLRVYTYAEAQAGCCAFNIWEDLNSDVGRPDEFQLDRLKARLAVRPSWMIKAPRRWKRRRAREVPGKKLFPGIVYVQTYSGRNIGGRRAPPRINRDFSVPVLLAPLQPLIYFFANFRTLILLILHVVSNSSRQAENRES